MDANKTILIVDDHTSTRKVLEGLLTGQGYDLFFAADGPEGLAQAMALTPDVMLLDVMMPGMDGFEVCRRLRAEPRLAEVPVIMITALDDRKSRLRGFEAGADDFISKPFDPMELRTRVQTIAQLNRYRRLHTERAKFEWVVEKADDGYLLVSDQDLILYANPRACSYLGLAETSNYPLSETFLVLANQQYRCEPQEKWLSWPEPPAEPLPRYLVRPETAINGPLWLQVEQMEMASGDGDRYLIRLRDVTDKIAAQRLMWSFHGQISHKLRTPIMSLMGSLYLLKQDRGVLSEQQQEILFASAYESGLRLQHEVQDIFQYLELPHFPSPIQQPCGLAELPALIDEIKTVLTVDTVLIEQQPAEGVNGIGQVDLPLSRPAMTLILQELLENAQKFHPEHKPVIEVNLLVETEQLRLQVGDNGVTLSPAQLIQIWAPYYQGEKYFTGQIAGMGLGLAMVAALVWEAGGSCLAFNRESGPGVVIELRLPLKTGKG
jgi:CheY-like chemotaxis protein